MERARASRQRRCRVCGISAEGGEVPLRTDRGRWTRWHVCGRCWGFLTLGLRKQRGDPELNLFANLERLMLRPDRVRAAVREGLVIAGRHGAQLLEEEADALREGQRLLADLQSLGQDIEESLSTAIPSGTWRDVRHRVLQLRAQIRELRERYTGG